MEDRLEGRHAGYALAGQVSDDIPLLGGSMKGSDPGSIIRFTRYLTKSFAAGLGG
jgi:hypothetical protein